MDFKGQLYCERLFQILVILFGLVGFVVGYIQQDFRLTFYFLATGGGLSAVVRTRPLPRPARTRSARRAGVYAAALHAAMCLATSPLLALCARRSACPIGLGGIGTRSNGSRWRMRWMRRSTSRRRRRRRRPRASEGASLFTLRRRACGASVDGCDRSRAVACPLRAAPPVSGLVGVARLRSADTCCTERSGVRVSDAVLANPRSGGDPKSVSRSRAARRPRVSARRASTALSHVSKQSQNDHNQYITRITSTSARVTR